MNIKRYLLAVLVVFLSFEGMNYLVNSVLLTECYNELESLWRKNMMDYMWLMYLTDFLFTLIFVSIYSRWSKKFSFVSGILFGLLVGLMMNTTGLINQWIVYPITNHLMVLWIIFGWIQFVVCGLLLGLIYKPLKKEPV